MASCLFHAARFLCLRVKNLRWVSPASNRRCGHTRHLVCAGEAILAKAILMYVVVKSVAFGFPHSRTVHCSYNFFAWAPLKPYSRECWLVPPFLAMQVNQQRLEINRARIPHLFLHRNFAHILLSIVLDMSPIHAWTYNQASGFCLSLAMYKNP